MLIAFTGLYLHFLENLPPESMSLHLKDLTTMRVLVCVNTTEFYRILFDVALTDLGKKQKQRNINNSGRFHTKQAI